MAFGGCCRNAIIDARATASSPPARAAKRFQARVMSGAYVAPLPRIVWQSVQRYFYERDGRPGHDAGIGGINAERGSRVLTNSVTAAAASTATAIADARNIPPLLQALQLHREGGCPLYPEF